MLTNYRARIKRIFTNYIPKLRRNYEVITNKQTKRKQRRDNQTRKVKMKTCLVELRTR